ncbi:MAG: hypothetical protein WA431_01030 [Candidatus Cybelea sp.]
MSRLQFCELAQSYPMPWVRKGIELRRDLALEPRYVARAGMLARAAAITAMPLVDRLASQAIYGVLRRGSLPAAV